MAVDVVVAREDSWVANLGFPDVMTQLWILAGLTIIVWGLESASEYILEVLWRNLAQSVPHELRIDAYGHVQKLELAYFEEHSMGGLMAILNDDINQLERFLDGGANKIIQVIVTVLVIGGMFFWVASTAAIQRSMARIAVGRTTIMIAHRLSTIRNTHQIFVLDKDRLVEQGIVSWTPNHIVVQKSDQPEQVIDLPTENPYTNMWQALAKAWQENKEPYYTTEKALRDVAVVETVAYSIKTGQRAQLVKSTLISD
jgi:hypothetical protein